MIKKSEPRKICSFCKKSFGPDYRHRNNQKTCGESECQRQRRIQATVTKRKKIVDYHQQHYRKYIKPKRDRLKALKAKLLTAAVREPNRVDGRQNLDITPLVLVKRMRDQITAYLDEYFTALEKNFQKSDLISDACLMISDA